MNYVIITKNKNFEKIISQFFHQKNKNLLVVNSLAKLYAYYFRHAFTTVIIDQDYIQLKLSNIILFIKSYGLQVLLLTIDSKNLLYNKVYKTKKGYL